MKITQKQAVLNYLWEHGTITAKQAERELGCMRLAARIGDLKEDGHRFKKEMITVRGRYGRTKVARYSFDD